LKDIALISKNCGGIGIDISDIRANGDYIKGSSGYSSGVCRMLRVYNETAKYIDQREFLRIRHESQIPELRTTDLNHCIAIPDIFIVRVQDDDYWTTFLPMDAKILLGYDLNGLYGQKFNDAYIRCEVELKCKKTIKAWKLFFDIIKMQYDTGKPFLFFIDNTNKKSNQGNIGPIITPNLCTEIVEHTENISVCNLRAVILPNHISSENEFNFTELQHSVRLLVNSCDRSIDLTSYPLSECEIVNKSDRPIAVGVIGLATLYKKLRYSWEDEKARELNKKIFANMYYAALDESCNLACEHGLYDNYKGSPVSKGILQYNMCDSDPCPELDWSSLKQRIKEYGV
ncbi:2499_t:CDS:2, partial [Racocetra persica]